MSSKLTTFFRTRMYLSCPHGTRWSRTIRYAQMTTMSTSFGGPKSVSIDASEWLSSAGWRNESAIDGLIVTRTPKGLGLTTTTGLGRPVRQSSSLFNLFVSYTQGAGRFDTFDHWSRGRGEDEDEPMHDAPPVAVDRNLTGDEAFQRRLAMSAAAGRPRSPPPTLSPQAPPQAMAEHTPPTPAAPPPLAETGDEAYLRRLAMSTMNRAAAGMHARLPPSAHAVPLAPVPAQFEQAASERPHSVSPPPLAYNPFAPPTSVPPPPPGPPAAIPNALEEKMKAAAAIAARLSALANAGPSAGHPPPVQEGHVEEEKEPK